MSIQLSILVPAYNEAGNIARAIETSYGAGKNLGISFEIVAIDDGSADETGAILTKLEQEFPELLVVRHEQNQGLGAALRNGIRAARGQFCIIAPADNPHTAETIQPFLDQAEDADLVLGYRTHRLGYTWLMKFNTRVYHWLLHGVCGVPYRDVNWIHLYRRSIFEQIGMDFRGIVMEAEVVLKAHLLGLRIREVPCQMQIRTTGQASAARPKVMFKTGKDLTRLLWLWRTGNLRVGANYGLLREARSLTASRK
jgi:glycosyltransferase involved in cell wall biosynthesis